MRSWWTIVGYAPAHVPEYAKRAMFSSWYNFQKGITGETVFEQCRMAKEYGLDTVILDPRFPEVRAWLVETYENAVRDWDLDGMKLDFIDSFSLAAESSPVTEEMDCPSLEAAVEKLLSEIMTALRKLKHEIMIEFRQSHIGPVVQKFGNILRVGDCAGGSLINRVSRSRSMRQILRAASTTQRILSSDREPSRLQSAPRI